MTEKYVLGSTGFAQVGNENYRVKSEIECHVLMEHLNKKFGKRIKNSGGRLVWASHNHDFGTYHEMEFHISEEKIKETTWGLIDDLESFEWESPEIILQMQEMFDNKIQGVKEKIEISEDIERKAKELEKSGAIVILPEEVENVIQNKESMIDEVIKKSEKENSFVHIDINSLDINDLLDSIVPACCKYGCEVEPDGICPHGNPSILIHYGLI